MLGRKEHSRSGFENPAGLLLGDLEAARNRPCPPRTHTKSLMFSVPVQSQSFERHLGQSCLCISESFLEKQEAAGTPARGGHWQATFRVFPVADQCQDLPHRPPCLQHSCTTRPRNQTPWGPSLSTWSSSQPPIMEGCLADQRTHHNHIMQGLTSI